MNENLKELLKQLPESELRTLVQSLYGTDKQVDSQIEAALLATDSAELAEHLKKRVQSIKRGSRFISYGESHHLSLTLDQLVDQIQTLLPDDPKAAFELANLLMGTHENVYNRCDDSGGSVGDSYRTALRLWLDSAAAWQASGQPCKLDWSAEVLKRHKDNGYGVWDYLISGSLEVVGEQPLRKLAQKFETDIKRLSLDEDDDYIYNAELSNAELGLKAVAEALGDVKMFERSYVIIKADPNELQKEHIVKFCLLQKDAESALKWLAGDWEPRMAARQQSLMDETYVMLGRSDDLLAVRREAYDAEPDFERLQALLEVVPDAEQEALHASAASRASSSEDIIVAVDTLMRLQDMEAVSIYILQHPEKLHDVGYYSLADWAVRFEQAEIVLAAITVYRVLLLDILDAGRYKAYRHAAKYFKALGRLEQKVEASPAMISKAEFDKDLRSRHGLKRSFWSLVA